MGTAADKTEEEMKKACADRRAARDAKRAARDARRASDSMTEEEESAEDSAECAEDAEEEKDDEKDDSKEARDRKSARDRRAGARDARKGARDRIARARDSKKGMDTAEVTALVRAETGKAVTEATAGVRRDAIAAQKLYGRLSPIIGAFDHDEMSHAEMAAYGLKKLGQAEAADPVVALDYFLAGRGAQSETRQRGAQDGAAATGGSLMERFRARKTA